MWVAEKPGVVSSTTIVPDGGISALTDPSFATDTGVEKPGPLTVNANGPTAPPVATCLEMVSAVACSLNSHSKSDPPPAGAKAVKVTSLPEKNTIPE